MNYFLGIDASSGILVADFEDTQAAATIPSRARRRSRPTRWHHAAATYDGTTWRLYLDGALDAKLAPARPPVDTRSSTRLSAARSTRLASRTASSTASWTRRASGTWLGRAPRSAPDKDSESPSRRRSARSLASRRRHRSRPRRQLRTRRHGHAHGRPDLGFGLRLPARTRPRRPTRPASWPRAATRRSLPGTRTPSPTSPATTSTARPLAVSTPARRSTAGSRHGDGLTDTGLTNGHPVLLRARRRRRLEQRLRPPRTRRARRRSRGDPVFVGAGDIADCTPDAGHCDGDARLRHLRARSSRWATTSTWTARRPSSRTATARRGGATRTARGRPPATTTTTRRTRRDRLLRLLQRRRQPDGPGRRPQPAATTATTSVHWHIVVLNSECTSAGFWLQRAAARRDPHRSSGCATIWPRSPTNNIIAMWHRPRFYSSSSALDARVHAGALAGAVRRRRGHLLGGHWHNYERLAPMNAAGATRPDLRHPAFVVGTGGAGSPGFGRSCRPARCGTARPSAS